MATEGRSVLACMFERLARGEAGALDEVCRRYGDRVRWIARRNLGKALRSRMESADLSQEVMAHIVREAPGRRFPSESAFLRWVSAFVNHGILRAASYWKAACRRIEKVTFFQEEGSLADPRAERPDQILDRMEASDQITEGIARLSPRDREVIVARLISKLPWPMIAASLETSICGAQMRLLRARRRLARILERPGCCWMTDRRPDPHHRDCEPEQELLRLGVPFGGGGRTSPASGATRTLPHLGA